MQTMIPLKETNSAQKNPFKLPASVGLSFQWKDVRNNVTFNTKQYTPKSAQPKQHIFLIEALFGIY